MKGVRKRVALPEEEDVKMVGETVHLLDDTDQGTIWLSSDEDSDGEEEEGRGKGQHDKDAGRGRKTPAERKEHPVHKVDSSSGGSSSRGGVRAFFKHIFATAEEENNNRHT